MTIVVDAEWALDTAATNWEYEKHIFLFLMQEDYRMFSYSLNKTSLITLVYLKHKTLISSRHLFLPYHPPPSTCLYPPSFPPSLPPSFHLHSQCVMKDWHLLVLICILTAVSAVILIFMEGFDMYIANPVRDQTSVNTRNVSLKVDVVTNWMCHVWNIHHYLYFGSGVNFVCHYLHILRHTAFL